MDYFLGLDCSTQSLSGILIDFQEKKTLFSHSINFDASLPQYGTQHGVYTSNDGKVVHSNPLMWVEALELLFTIFLQEGLPLNDIKLITGSGQQHGTVYLNKSFETTLKNLNNEKSLVSQIMGTFTRETSPVWMDSSTTKECEEIRNQLGGLKSTIQITGSNTFERFSGPQIRKFYKDDPHNYSQTSIIHLVSSFLSSILLGKNSPIEHSDGAGMNLMNIKTKEWDNRALNSTAPDLKKKLPPLTQPYNIIGKLAPFFVMRYGFSSETLLIPWSGDNPSSLIGVGLTGKGKAAISLGTSDTYFTYLKDLFVDLCGEGQVFGAPTGDYMGLICYKNGSLARERIKDNFNLNWIDFSNILANTPPGNYGKIMLPYFFPEIVPLVSNPKVYRFGFDDSDLEGNVRAVVEAQFLSMKLHSEWIQEPPEEIYATGGGSTNLEILKVAANIFNTNIRQFDVTNSAALGAALRSVKSYYNSKHKFIDWTELVESFIKIKDSIIIHPDKKFESLYYSMLTIYQKYEDYILRNGEDPELSRQNFIKKYFKN
jgi:xylulokinase